MSDVRAAREEAGSAANEDLAGEPLGASSAESADVDASASDAATGMADVADSPDESDLLVDLAQAMHQAVDARRDRTLDAVEHRRAVHVQGIRERGATEAEALREQAGREVVGIEDWATAEIARIHAERERRSEARTRELDALLDRHGAQVEWEIEAIEEAVAGHRSDLEVFFTRLGTETDVTVMAQLAQNVPQLPDLDGISTAARARAAVGRAPSGSTAAKAVEVEAPAATADAIEATAADHEEEEVDEDRLIGVMDPVAPVSSLDMDFGSRPLEPVVEAEALELVAEAPTLEPLESRPIEPVGEERTLAPVAEARSSGGPLLQAIPALRPVAAWLNHGSGNDHDEKKSE